MAGLPTKPSGAGGAVGPKGPWDTARKILAQELRTGCQDRTVYGGLEKFLSNWLRSVSSDPPSLHAIGRKVSELLREYGRRSPEDRAEAVRAALGQVDRVLRPGAGAAAGARPSGTDGKAGPEGERAARRSPPRSAPGRQADGSLRLEDPVIGLRGVGKLRAGKLAKLGVERIGDLLTHYPRDYRDYRSVKRVVELMYGETASVLGVVDDVQVTPGPKRRFRATVRVRDETGRISATWFRYGYSGSPMPLNARVALAGRVAGFAGSIAFESPDWELADRDPLHTRRLVPVYPLTEGISDYWLRELMASAVPAYAPQLVESLPGWLLRQYGLLGISQAVMEAHFPTSPEKMEQARLRLAFEELLLVQLAALKRKAEWREGAAAPRLEVDDGVVEGFLACQPFALTDAQCRVVGEIRSDLASDRPMTRLLQGEVGSGKTIVAAVALLSAVARGFQGALMAPTEILAEQHGRTLSAAFEHAGDFVTRLLGRPLRLEVLTGASRRSERQAAYEGASTGDVDILVGTQALIQEGLGFRSLGLVVVDEQHRFGVAQRAALREKGGTPHLLVMTATPIPRTLALTAYGDLDLSVIDQLPPGRQKVRTRLLAPSERGHAYEHIRREVAQGRQAFIICPLVEDNPNLEARAATAEYERLRRGELSSLRLALLHGRMRPADKERVMLDFRNGEFDVLVSTSVVEVGIDVSNATVVLIEGAERFGLAQLHQFRGRVGRGSHPSTCILLSDSAEEDALARLRTVSEVSDGFRLAEEDLRLRGPGEYFGVRQSGFPDFRMASLSDVALVEKAREAATELLRRDPTLVKSEQRVLARRIADLRTVGGS